MGNEGQTHGSVLISVPYNVMQFTIIYLIHVFYVFIMQCMTIYHSNCNFYTLPHQLKEQAVYKLHFKIDSYLIEDVSFDQVNRWTQFVCTPIVWQYCVCNLWIVVSFDHLTLPPWILGEVIVSAFNSSQLTLSFFFRIIFNKWMMKLFVVITLEFMS